MVSDVDGGVALMVHVQPGAKRTAVVGFHGDALKLSVAAVARDGEANEAVIQLVATLFNVPPRRVQLLSGGVSRRKRVLISGMYASEVLAVLQAYFPPK